MPEREPFPLPAVINPPGRRGICVPVPDDEGYVRVFAGVLQELTYWYNWQRDPLKLGKDAAAVWKEIFLSIDWAGGDCMGCCPEPTNRRYNAEGQLEVSYDNGATWEVKPELDERYSGTIAPPLPGADGNDKKCIAATSGQEYVKANLIDELTTGMSYAELNAAGVALIALLGVTGIGILIAAFAAAVFLAGVAATQAAFTSEVWADFKCILYCNINPDGSFSAIGWENVKADILSTFTGIVSAVLYNWVNSVGVVGLTNSARSGFATSGECSACTCDLNLIWYDQPGQVSSGTVVFQGAGVWRVTLGTDNTDGTIYSLGSFKAEDGRCFLITAIDPITGAYTRTYRALCGGGEGFGSIIATCMTAVVVDRFDAVPLVETVVFDVHAEDC